MSDDTCCGSGDVLISACAGAANVGEVTDRADRRLMADGAGRMFCLTGMGADIEGMVQSAKDSERNLVIAGCPVNCAAKVFERLGISNYEQITVTDLGIEKVLGVWANDDQVEQVVDCARKTLDEGLTEE
ncbi:MAG: putative zinc-binding protein [Candidatus Brocadiia bacterium]